MSTKTATLAAVLAFLLSAGEAEAKRPPLPPHYQMWMCIHSKEGAWNDRGAPYYGGLQMGWWFMQTYGAWLLKRKGTADKWKPIEQLWTAEKAFKREGYSLRWLRGQWPNTSPGCV